MRRGFSILELLAASLLLSLLVTALTMIFNQTSIAWRTGVADVAELGDTRAELGTIHDIEDDALPGLGETGYSTGASDNRAVRYRTVSIFRNWGGGSLGRNQSTAASGRLYDEIPASTLWGRIQDARKGTSMPLANGKTRSRSAYIVGVRSAGPDGNFATEDDNISTLPEEKK